MTIKPIKTKNDYHDTLHKIEKIWDAKPGSPNSDLLEVLTILVEKYENDHFAITPSDPVEAIKFRMEQEGLQQKDLVRFFPGKNRVSEVLNRKRPLSLGMIRSLHVGLGIPAAVLIR